MIDGRSFAKIAKSSHKSLSVVVCAKLVVLAKGPFVGIMR